jgi:hypothetical protein
MNAVRQEIVIFPLFAVGNDWRAAGFEAFDSVSNCVFVERSESRILTIELAKFLDEIKRSCDTANGLGGYGDWYRLSVAHACAPFRWASEPLRPARCWRCLKRLACDSISGYS